MNEHPSVIVAGGGLAGITAALRLAERGYTVDLYEQKQILGGDLASREGKDGVPLDVYPHMYLSWYRNFWNLIGGVPGVRREDRFHPFSTVMQLRRGEFPRTRHITNLYSLRDMVQNLFSGMAPPADMYVAGYSAIDLLAETCNPTVPLEEVSVTGFLRARPYMTDRAADAVDTFITMIWAIPAFLAAADDYRDYLMYSFADHDPAYWLANGSALEQVIAPLEAALANHKVTVHTSKKVSKVVCQGNGVTAVEIEDGEFDQTARAWIAAGDSRVENVDELVLAVPPEGLTELVRSGGSGTSIVDAAPGLAEVSRLRSERIPIVHLYFRDRRAGIPPEPVGMYRSPLALAFTDISQRWAKTTDFGGGSVLSVSASNPYALPGTSPEDDAFAIVRELADYLDFRAGTKWGESPDIDWDRTLYEPNTDTQLSVNETGADPWRPVPGCPEVVNLSLAGDFCRNDVGMMTIESAVTTGLAAASAIVERRGIGVPVEILTPSKGYPAFYAWARYAWAPYAATAKVVSTGRDLLSGVFDSVKR
jgi:phytoene dehydrogenase-like protein